MPENDIIELPGTPGQGARTAHRRVLAHIMHMRLEEMLEYALDEISRAGYHQRLPAGVVLTGGGALTPGIVELGREVFAMPVRVGTPGQGLTGLADSVESPRQAVPRGAGPLRGPPGNARERVRGRDAGAPSRWRGILVR